jgi:hypothetical protein
MSGVSGVSRGYRRRTGEPNLWVELSKPSPERGNVSVSIRENRLIQIAPVVPYLKVERMIVHVVVPEGLDLLLGRRICPFDVVGVSDFDPLVPLRRQAIHGNALHLARQTGYLESRSVHIRFDFDLSAFLRLFGSVSNQIDVQANDGCLVPTDRLPRHVPDVHLMQ